MIQTLMNPLKVIQSISCHSGESRARSEALALSSNFKSFWTPALAGVTRIETFQDFVKIGILNFGHWNLFGACNLGFSLLIYGKKYY